MTSKWQETLGALAPTAATLLGGPFAGMAVGAIMGALGIGEPAEHKDPVKAVTEYLTNNQLTGDQIVRLKEAELLVKQHLEDNNIRLEEIASSDRDSARKREIAVKDNTPKVLAYTVTMGFFSTLYLLMYGEIPDKIHDVLLVMVGSLGTAWTGIIYYYFGSSAGSKAKTDILAGIGK
jgi:hypothetical protein